MARSKSLLALGIAILLCLLAILAFLIFSRKSEETRVKEELQKEDTRLKQASAASAAMTNQMIEGLKNLRLDE